MKKFLVLSAVLLAILFGYYYFASQTKVKAPPGVLEHDVPVPQPGEKNSEMLNMEPLYEIVVQDVMYYGKVQGFYAEPVNKGEYPGVIMVHEWWGLNDHIKDMAAKLAEQGYRVLAVDLFGTVATTSEQARAQVSGLNQQDAIANMQAAKDYLEGRGSTKIGSLGWCFGGGQSLQVSLNTPVDATVIYYGSLVTDQSELSNLSAPVLGIFGSEDTSIPVETVNEFEKQLNSLNIENSITVYEGVGHAFANPSGNNYSEEETLDAWKKTLKFLDTYLN